MADDDAARRARVVSVMTIKLTETIAAYVKTKLHYWPTYFASTDKILITYYNEINVFMHYRFMNFLLS